MWDWFGDLLGLGLDAGGDVVDALPDLAADLGDLGDTGEMFFDTATGSIVSADEMQAIMDLDFSGSGAGPVGDILGPQNYDWDAAALGETGPGFATPGQVDATTPYNASSGLSMPNWAKSLASGLGNALGGLGGGLSGLGRGAGDGGGLPGTSPMMGAGGGGGVPGMQGPLDAGGLAGLIRPGSQDAIGAAFASLTPAQRAQLGMQSPIDRGPDPVKFTPLQIPTAGAQIPMAGVAPAQRLSGLQRLMTERLG